MRLSFGFNTVLNHVHKLEANLRSIVATHHALSKSTRSTILRSHTSDEPSCAQFIGAESAQKREELEPNAPVRLNAALTSADLLRAPSALPQARAVRPKAS